MSYTDRVHYYFKAAKQLDTWNYETRKKELEKLETELADDEALTDTDKTFIKVKIIDSCKEYYKV